MALCCCAIAGFLLPDLLLVNAGQKRADQIRKALPNTIDLLTVSVESGLAFDASLANVTRNTEGPLAQEFTRVLREIRAEIQAMKLPVRLVLPLVLGILPSALSS